MAQKWTPQTTQTPWDFFLLGPIPQILVFTDTKKEWDTVSGPTAKYFFIKFNEVINCQ